MRVFFPYETKNREFDGKLLLSSFLLNRGFTIFIGSRKAMKIEALSCTKGIYFLKSLSNEEKGFYDELRRRGHKIVLLHAEGGIHYKKNEENILSAFNPKLLAYIDRNYIFGSSIKNSIELLTSYKNNLVTGEPRFDLLKPKYNQYFGEELKRIRNKYQSYVLINTNFGLSNSFVGEEKLLKYYGTENTMTDESKRLLLYKMDFQKRVFNAYLDAIRFIAGKFKNINFIVRPHPSESEEGYLRIASEFPNVHVNKEGNVVQWILGAKSIIHYDCTTGMEAALAGIPVISFLPEKDENILAWLPVALSIEVINIEQLVKTIDAILLGEQGIKKISSEIHNIWKGFVYNVEFESSDIIGNDLMGIVSGAGSITYKPDLRTHFINKFFRIRRDLKNIKDKLSNQKSITKSKFGVTNKREIEQKLSVLAHVNKFNYKIRVVRLSHDAFKIENK